MKVASPESIDLQNTLENREREEAALFQANAETMTTPSSDESQASPNSDINKIISKPINLSEMQKLVREFVSPKAK